MLQDEQGTERRGSRHLPWSPKGTRVNLGESPRRVLITCQTWEISAATGQGGIPKGGKQCLKFVVLLGEMPKVLPSRRRWGGGEVRSSLTVRTVSRPVPPPRPVCWGLFSRRGDDPTLGGDCF